MSYFRRPEKEKGRGSPSHSLHVEKGEGRLPCRGGGKDKKSWIGDKVEFMKKKRRGGNWFPSWVSRKRLLAQHMKKKKKEKKWGRWRHEDAGACRGMEGDAVSSCEGGGVPPVLYRNNEGRERWLSLVRSCEFKKKEGQFLCFVQGRGKVEEGCLNLRKRKERI